MRYIERFPTIEDLRSATPEQIGVTIVEHTKTLGPNRRTFTLLAPDDGMGVQGHYRDLNEATLLIAEGVEWARRALLLVPDLNQPFPNGWIVLSRAGRDFEAERDLDLIRLREALPRSLLHPKVKEACLDIFEAGRFQAAVFEAFLLIEVAVRENAGFTADDFGTPMIAKAFHPEQGPLRDATRPDGERQAMMRFMTGAHGVFKNPRSHRNIDHRYRRTMSARLGMSRGSWKLAKLRAGRARNCWGIVYP
jgi:uncharacterized protein (TIGR02391 family)